MTNSKELEQLIKVAQGWASDGIPVFPVKDNKAPLTENGFYDAVSSPNEVRAVVRVLRRSGVGHRRPHG